MSPSAHSVPRRGTVFKACDDLGSRSMASNGSRFDTIGLVCSSQSVAPSNTVRSEMDDQHQKKTVQQHPDVCCLGIW